jgi:hypothetical protein
MTKVNDIDGGTSRGRSRAPIARQPRAQRFPPFLATPAEERSCARLRALGPPLETKPKPGGEISGLRSPARGLPPRIPPHRKERLDDRPPPR